MIPGKFLLPLDGMLVHSSSPPPPNTETEWIVNCLAKEHNLMTLASAQHLMRIFMAFSGFQFTLTPKTRRNLFHTRHKARKFVVYLQTNNIPANPQSTKTWRQPQTFSK